MKYFRTGDYIRRYADGSYAVIGMADRMIKLCGLRIEPGEIENNPYRVMIPAGKDERFFEHIGRDALGAIESSAPQHDVGYRILCRNKYPYPYMSYNCLVMIEENENFLFSAVPGKAAPVEKSAAPDRIR